MIPLAISIAIRLINIDEIIWVAFPMQYIFNMTTFSNTFDKV